LFDELDESTPDALEEALEAEAPAKEGPRLKLEVPELPAEGSATTEGTGGAADGALALEQADVVAHENEELRAKAKEADEIISLFKQQIAAKDKELAVLQTRVAALEAAARSAAQGASNGAGAPAPMALDDVSASLTSTPLLGALAVGVLLVGWWGYRRRQAASSPPLLTPEPMPLAEVEAPPPLWAQGPPAGMSVEEITGSDNSTLETVRLTVPPGAGEPDSLEEVNIFLAYERFEEAEDLVRAAIRTRPDHHAYKLRLLEVLYAANRRRSFEEAARELHLAVGVDSPLWQDALAMWQEMSPGRALFAPITGPEEVASDDARPTTEFVDISAPPAVPGAATGDANRPLASAPALDLDLAATPEPGSARPVVVDIATGLGIDREHTGARDPRAPVPPEVLDQSVEFDLADTIWPGETPVTAATGGPDSRAEDYHLEFDIGGLGDTTDLSQALALELDPLARSVDLDLSLRDTGGALRAPAASNLEPASSEGDLEFDLSLQDTTDLETLNMREVLKDLEQTVVAPEQAAGESLAEITRSMEASIASLDVDAEPGPDLALEPLDADGDDRDFEFTLDGGPGSLIDTLSLDPGLLEKPADQRNREDIALDLDLDDADEPSPLYETDTKLSLAKAYLELGDADGARQILDEVLQTGNAVQQEEARRLLPPQG
jgi:pilus assembly protein FimV